MNLSYIMIKISNQILELPDFVSVTGYPSYHIHSQHIESVQHAFRRHLAFHATSTSHRKPYNQRLVKWFIDEFKTYLQSRRKILDLCFLHKIILSKVKCSKLLERLLLFFQKTFDIPFTSSHGPYMCEI